MKFLTSKFSGYLSLVLLAAMVAGAWYIYSQGKMLGGAKEKLEAYEVTIAQQEAANKRLIAESEKKNQALQKQTDNLAILRKNTQLQRLAVQEARKDADKALRECLDMRIADGMRFGPSRENRDSEDQAGPSVDG
jgi:membrane glycosyltransferase